MTVLFPFIPKQSPFLLETVYEQHQIVLRGGRKIVRKKMRAPKCLLLFLACVIDEITIETKDGCRQAVS